VRTSTKIKTAVVLFNLAAAVHAARTGRAVGRFLGVPYDFTRPTLDKVRDRLWNEKESAIVTPPVFGAGWSVNLLEVVRRTGLLLPPEEEPEEQPEEKSEQEPEEPS